MRRLVVTVLLIVGLSSSVDAQRVHVAETSRPDGLMAETYLQDTSAILHYTMGGVAIRPGRRSTEDPLPLSRFLRLRVTTTLPEIGRSESFHLSGSDTVEFRHDASFSDLARLAISTDVDWDTLPTPQRDSVQNRLDSLIRLFDDGAVVPSNTFFPGTSIVKYIVSLRAASDGSLIMDLDTLNCYQLSPGGLRFTTTSEDWSCRIGLSGARAGTEAYVSVRIEHNLPTQRMEHHRALEHWSMENMACARWRTNCYQEKRPISYVAGLQLSFNPVTHEATLRLESHITSGAIVEVVDLLGNVQLSFEHVIPLGWSSFSFDFGALPEGRYIVRVNVNRQSLSRSLSIAGK